MKSVIQISDPAGSVCELVRKNDIGLIVMSATAAPQLSVASALGCAPDRSCRSVPVPVMRIGLKALRRPVGFGRLINRILVPIDDAPASRLALPVAAEMARGLHIGITLFAAARIIVPVVYADDGSSLVDYTLINQIYRDRRATELADIEGGLTAKGLEVDRLLVPGFRTADEIIAAGRRSGADLIVMSGDERPGLARRLFGSLTLDLLRHGDLPVVQVHSRVG